jgi:hypothetical protein
MPLTIMNPKSAVAAPPPVSESDAALAAIGPAGFSQTGSALGSLIDTDLTRESARLTDLQNRQRLAGGPLSNTNRTPRTLLSLFGYA